VKNSFVQQHCRKNLRSSQTLNQHSIIPGLMNPDSMNEVIDGAKSCGYNLRADFAVEHMKRTETMGAYKPSTLLDFEAGRALEVEAIWGEPLRRAHIGGTTMPRLAQLYALLKSLDARRE
jgi:ketopantoate reductase